MYSSQNRYVFSNLLDKSSSRFIHKFRCTPNLYYASKLSWAIMYSRLDFQPLHLLLCRFLQYYQLDFTESQPYIFHSLLILFCILWSFSIFFTFILTLRRLCISHFFVPYIRIVLLSFPLEYGSPLEFLLMSYFSLYLSL